MTAKSHGSPCGDLVFAMRGGSGTVGGMEVPFRVGQGYDVHRIVPGRRLVLGGVEIPCDFGLDGHSDADVLTHAIADAVFGAAGLPDIGHWFPDTDAVNAGIDSQRILARAVAEAKKGGWHLANIDATLVAERPKIAPHLTAMRAAVAATCGIAPEAVGIKATTNERIGFAGRGEGMAALAVALLARAP